MEYDRSRVHLLLNRANTNVGIERDDVLAILGREVDIMLPSAREITRSVNQGEPIAYQKASDAAKAFAALADLYVNAARARATGDQGGDLVELPKRTEPEPAKPQRQSIFRRNRKTA
jgi:septum formation inhibitor-activating ATPase MinD